MGNKDTCLRSQSSEGYSKWTLQPLNPETAALYREYTRSQVRGILLPISALFAVLLVINLPVSLKNNKFHQIKQHMTLSLVFFFLNIGILFIGLAAFVLSKKYSVAIEFIIPVYGLYVCLFCLPTFIESYTHPTYNRGVTLM